MSPEPGAAAGQPAPRRLPKRAIAFTLALIAALLGLTMAIEPLREAALDVISGETASLRKDLRDLGAGGVALVAALAALHTFIWYPAEILDAAAGYVYGFWPAMAILVVCWTAQGMLAYEIGNRAARPILDRYIDPARFRRVERAINDGGVTLLLAARLVPIVPFSLFSYVAGAAAVPRAPLRVDDRGRIPADHGHLRLSGHAARGVLDHGPANLDRRGRDHRAAASDQKAQAAL